MIAYFAKLAGEVGYFGRFRSGRSIGTGAVEGLGRRLKVSGWGWDVGNLDGMSSLVATVDTPEWTGLWARPAA